VHNRCQLKITHVTSANVFFIFCYDSAQDQHSVNKGVAHVIIKFRPPTAIPTLGNVRSKWLTSSYAMLALLLLNFSVPST